MLDPSGCFLCFAAPLDPPFGVWLFPLPPLLCCAFPLPLPLPTQTPAWSSMASCTTCQLSSHHLRLVPGGGGRQAGALVLVFFAAPRPFGGAVSVLLGGRLVCFFMLPWLAFPTLPAGAWEGVGSVYSRAMCALRLEYALLAASWRFFHPLRGWASLRLHFLLLASGASSQYFAPWGPVLQALPGCCGIPPPQKHPARLAAYRRSLQR